MSLDTTTPPRTASAGPDPQQVQAFAGGLLGHTVAGRGNGTIGALLGAAGGGLAGNAIDKSDNPRYCRR